MKLALFSDTFAPEINGVALTLGRLTDYLERYGIEYQVFAPEMAETVPAEPHINRFMSLPFLFYRECRLALPNPIRLNETLDQFQPDLVHIATPFNMGLFGLNYGKKHDIPMVASYHTNFDEYLQYYHLPFLNQWIWSYMRWFHRQMETVYVPSHSTKHKLMTNQIHSNIEIWGRGVDTNQFTPQKRNHVIRRQYAPDHKHIILYVGRMAPEKNVDRVLQAFLHLPEYLRNTSQLVMVGDGPLCQVLSRQYAHDHILFTGFIEGEELAQLYAAADVFVFPSATETFGNVVLEALASGLPVIGANEGGVKHLIEDKHTGRLCNPGQTDDFVQALTSLLGQSSLLQQYSCAARLSALSYSWDDIFSKLVESYERAAYQRIQGHAS